RACRAARPRRPPAVQPLPLRVPRSLACHLLRPLTVSVKHAPPRARHACARAWAGAGLPQSVVFHPGLPGFARSAPWLNRWLPRQLDASVLGLAFAALVFVTMRYADPDTVTAAEQHATGIPHVLQAQRQPGDRDYLRDPGHFRKCEL